MRTEHLTGKASISVSAGDRLARNSKINRGHGVELFGKLKIVRSTDSSKHPGSSFYVWLHLLNWLLVDAVTVIHLHPHPIDAFKFAVQIPYIDITCI